MPLTPESAQKLDEFFTTFTDERESVLFLDYDGTLAPFRVDRFEAVPWPGVREALNRIQSQGRTHMVVITGRPAHEIGPLLGLTQPIEVWGLHGFERLYPDGRREPEPIPAQVQHKLDELHAALARDAFGGLFEYKANAAVMHWRGLTPEKAEEVRRRTIELFEPASRIAGLRLLPFEDGVELRTGRDKGGAVRTLLRELGDRGPVAFLGDEISDEAGFREMKGHGLSVLVRPEWRETAADVWLQPPGELWEFLTRWMEAEA